MLLSKQAQQLTDWWRSSLTSWFEPLVTWLKDPIRKDKWYSKHSPNLATLLRAIISAGLLYALWRNMHNYPVRSLLITLLGFTFWLDGVDGMLATELDRKTLLGRIMDPVVDLATLVASGVFIYQLAWVNTNTFQNVLAVTSVAVIALLHLHIWGISLGRKREGDRLGVDIDSLPLGKLKLVYALAFTLLTAYLPAQSLMPIWICWVVLVPTELLCLLSSEEYLADRNRLAQIS